MASPPKSPARPRAPKKERRDSELVAENVAEEANRPWRTASRPARSAVCKDASFTLEDDTMASVMESLMHSFCIMDPLQPGNPIIFISPGFESMTGYSWPEVSGRNCKILKGPKTDKAAVDELAAGMERGQLVSVELVNYRKDGKPFRNLVCVVPCLDSGGQVLKFIGVQCDLDERAKRDVIDEHFTTRWVEQVRHYVGSFMLLDTSSERCPVAAVSEGLLALTAFSATDMIGEGCLTLCGPDSSAKSMKKLVQGAASDRPSAVRLLCYKKDGTPFWSYFFACPLPGRPLAACLLADITNARLKRVGKYVLGKVLGAGASGVVRKGKNAQTDELVAIKTVDASRFRSISEIEQIQEEMSVLSNLKHPNIIRLFEVHFLNDVFYFVMEYASGGSLVQHIYSNGRGCLDERETRRIFMQIMSALDYCHRRRVVHRDLKPENILMDENGNIKIADFGLAAVTAPFSGSLTLQCGTPEFTAPEIVQGKEYNGQTVDIWSVGVMLYEALSGQLPFKGPTQAALFKAIQKGTYEALPGHISADCRDLVRRLLIVSPEQRATMDQILEHPWCRSSEEQDTDSGTHVTSSEEAGTGTAAAAGGTGPSCSLSGNASSVSDFAEDAAAQSEPSSSYDAFSRTTRSAPPAAFHDSVRLIIPGMGDRDDPISAAILRSAEHVVGSSPGGARSGYDSDQELGSTGTVDGCSPVTLSPRAASFNAVMSPVREKISPSGLRSPAAATRLKPSHISTTPKRSPVGALPLVSPDRAGRIGSSDPGGLKERSGRVGSSPIRDRVKSLLTSEGPTRERTRAGSHGGGLPPILADKGRSKP